VLRRRAQFKLERTARGLKNPFRAGAHLMNARSMSPNPEEAHMLFVYIIAAAVLVCGCVTVTKRRRSRGS
jgi:hypothetical protein